MSTLERRWQPGADKTTALARLVDDIWSDPEPEYFEPQPTDVERQPERAEAEHAADRPLLNPEDFWEDPAAEFPTDQPWRSHFAAEQRQDPEHWRNHFAAEADQQREPDQEQQQRRGCWRNRFATRSRDHDPNKDLGLGL